MKKFVLSGFLFFYIPNFIQIQGSKNTDVTQKRGDKIDM